MRFITREPVPPNSTNPVGGGVAQARLLPFVVAIDLWRQVEFGSQDHAAGAVHAARIAARRQRLCRRVPGATHQVLGRAGLDPEAGWMVGHVGEHRDEGHPGACQRQAVVQAAVEVGHQRDHEIGLGVAPMARQALHQAGVAEADQVDGRHGAHAWAWA
jgi:hypothetical protein